MVSSNELIGINRQHTEIFKRVGNGSLDPSVVRRALQDIIEGKLPYDADWNPPIWWRTPYQQLEHARQLWPNAALPEPPKRFTPRTESEVLLLHVPDSFDAMWRKIGAPTSQTRYNQDGAISDKRSMRHAIDKIHFPAPTWTAFDPERGKGKRANSFWSRPDCAADEVLSALIQFPEWPSTWFKGASAPMLSGYQALYCDGWGSVPVIERWNSSQLELFYASADAQFEDRSCPSVRAC